MRVKMAIDIFKVQHRAVIKRQGLGFYPATVNVAPTFI